MINEHVGVRIDSPLYKDCSWCLTDSDVKFSYSIVESVDDLDYSSEIVGEAYVGEKITAVYGDNGCGDQFWMIFDNDKRIYDEDE